LEQVGDGPTREGVLTAEEREEFYGLLDAMADYDRCVSWVERIVAAHEAAACWETWQSLHDDLCTMRDWSGQCFVHTNPYRGAR
jgi:hypothetical protein